MADRVARPSQESVELSVVIPACNSGSLIAETIAALSERLSSSAEIIVVENGSTDGTFERCQDLARQWKDPAIQLRLLQSERGLGNALRTGALASVGRRVLMTADDLPFGFDDLDGAEKIAADRGKHARVVIGSKAHGDSRVARSTMRVLLSWGFALVRRLILRMRTGDPQGTFIVEGDLLRTLAPHIAEPGFLFTTELVHVLELLGVHPVEVPVRLRSGHAKHASRVTMRDAVVMAMGLLRVRRRHAANLRRGRAFYSLP